MQNSIQQYPQRVRGFYGWRSLLILGLLGAIASPGLALPSATPPAAGSTGSFARPRPPSTPPPNGTRGGGSLSGSTDCGTTAKPLIALIPVENPVLTTSAHPTLLVYVPYGSSQVGFGEFSVLVGLQETTRLYHARFTLPATPGIVRISLPNSPDYALQENLFYHWYFKLYCQGNTSSRADLGVDGWVKRTALPESSQPTESLQPTNAATPAIWYDTLSELADQLQTQPQDQELKDRWLTLLESIHAADLAQEPLVGSVTLLQK